VIFIGQNGGTDWWQVGAQIAALVVVALGWWIAYRSGASQQKQLLRWQIKYDVSARIEARLLEYVDWLTVAGAFLQSTAETVKGADVPPGEQPIIAQFMLDELNQLTAQHHRVRGTPRVLFEWTQVFPQLGVEVCTEAMTRADEVSTGFPTAYSMMHTGRPQDLSREDLATVGRIGDRLMDAAGFFGDVRLAVMECFSTELFDEVAPDLKLNHAYIDTSKVPWRLKARPAAAEDAAISPAAEATGV
jgi:hypothetical protein